MHCSKTIKYVWALLGVSAGIMAGSVFAARYQNFGATMMGYISSLCALFLFYLHLAYYKQWFHTWSKTKVNAVIIINWIIAALAFIALVLSLVFAGIQKQGISGDDLYGPNLWIIAVWCWMTFKWSMMSAVYCRRYAHKVVQNYVLEVGDEDNSSPPA